MKADSQPAPEPRLNDLCFRCGECCTRYQVLLDGAEAGRLAAYLGLSLPEFVSRYADKHWPGAEACLLRQGPGGCPFLRREGRQALCSIHSVKPRACRDWTPGLERRECREGLAKLWGLAVNSAGEPAGPPDKLQAFQDFLKSLGE